MKMGVVSHKDTKDTKNRLVISTPLWTWCLCAKYITLTLCFAVFWNDSHPFCCYNLIIIMNYEWSCRIIKMQPKLLVHKGVTASFRRETFLILYNYFLSSTGFSGISEKFNVQLYFFSPPHIFHKSFVAKLFSDANNYSTRPLWIMNYGTKNKHNS